MFEQKLTVHISSQRHCGHCIAYANKRLNERRGIACLYFFTIHIHSTDIIEQIAQFFNGGKKLDIIHTKHIVVQ